MKRLMAVLCAMSLSFVACSDDDDDRSDGGTTVTDGGNGDGGNGSGDGGNGDGGNGDGGNGDGGSNVQGSATVTGDIPNVTFSPQDAITLTDPDNAQGAIVAISDFANACDLAQGNTTTQGSQAIGIVLRNQTSGTPQALVPGTYNVTASTTPADGQTAVVAVVEADDVCEVDATAIATGGTVTVTSVSTTAGGGIEGTFSLEFPNLGTTNTVVTGTFDAPFCDDSGAPATPVCNEP